MSVYLLDLFTSLALILSEILPFCKWLKQSRRFRHAQAVTNRVRTTYPQAQMTAVGHSLDGTLAQDTRGSDKHITSNKATTLHYVLTHYPNRLPQDW
jgi:hypothetical protein